MVVGKEASLSSKQLARGIHTIQFLYLGDIIHENFDLSLEIYRPICLIQACLRQFGPDMYDMTTAVIGPSA